MAEDYRPYPPDTEGQRKWLHDMVDACPDDRLAWLASMVHQHAYWTPGRREDEHWTATMNATLGDYGDG